MGSTHAWKVHGRCKSKGHLLRAEVCPGRKRSLHTKDLREANIKAKPVLIEFDRILAKAAAIAKDVPLVRELSEIERLAAYQYASMLEED